MKRLLSVVLLMTMTIVAGVMTGCAGNETKETSTVSSAEDTSGELQKVTVLLDWTPNTNHTGIYVAIDQGYYEEAGLEVDVQIPYENTSTQLVGAGQGEFGISSTEDVLHAITLDDPMPVISIATIIQHNTSGFVSLKEDRITSPADWEGKTYGGYGGATEEKIVRSIAKASGVDPDSIKFVELGNSDTLSSLQGDIDFMWVFEAAEVTELKKEGVEYNYLPVADYGEEFDYYTPVIIANTDVAEENPGMVSSFIQATKKGYEYAEQNPDEAASIILNAVPDLDEYIVNEGQKYLSERYSEGADSWGVQDEAVWERYAAYLYDEGLIEKQADVKEAFTNKYLED